jgi:hypothetical protein
MIREEIPVCLGWEGMESFEIESMMPFIYDRRASKAVVIIA